MDTMMCNHFKYPTHLLHMKLIVYTINTRMDKLIFPTEEGCSSQWQFKTVASYRQKSKSLWTILKQILNLVDSTSRTGGKLPLSIQHNSQICERVQDSSWKGHRPTGCGHLFSHEDCSVSRRPVPS